MPPVMTTSPGYGGQTAPMDAMMATFGRTPMFLGDTGPRYTGPFNFNAGGPSGVMLQLMAPQLLQGFMGDGRIPAQFNPQQNFYDQMMSQQYYQASQQAMSMASRQDTASIADTLNGINRMMTGKELTEMQTARNFRMAQGVSQYMPLLTQILGPDLIDQLHGSRGSATVFAQQFHQAMRTSVDPVTGGAGYTGQSAGQVSQEVFQQLFGPGADRTGLRGMSAGQAGMLTNELQARGLLGQPMGMLSLQEQRAMVSKEINNATLGRLAEQLPEIQNILKEGGTPTDDMLAKARDRVRQSHAALIDPNVKMTEEDLKNLPGGEDILRATDAERISGRLKNLSGAVKAMRDIFGDMGNPNAPMREIINGLEALTQGGLSTMSAGDLEMMVRRTHTIAKQTGMGVQGLMGLAAQNAGLADQLGLDRSFAMRAAQQSALYGAAAGDTLGLNMPTWGALSKEELTLMDTQLRMHAAASPLANQLNAIARMADTGMATPGADTELSAIIDAVRAGQDTYQFGGQSRDIVMQRSQLLEILQRDAGISSSEAMAIIGDRFGNQEYGQRYNTDMTVRRIQAEETAQRLLMPEISNRFTGTLEANRVDDLLQASGVTENQGDFRLLMDQVAGQVSTDFLNLSPEDLRDPAKRRAALGQAFRSRLEENIRARMPNANPAEVQAVVQQVVDQMGGEEGLNAMGEVVYASANKAAAGHPLFKTGVGMHDALSQDAMKQAEARGRQAEADALMQSAFSSLGTDTAVERIVDTIQKAGPDSTWQELLSDVLGGVDVEEINAADPQGTVAQMMQLAQETSKLDASDPEQFAQLQRNAEVLRGLVEGGDVAREQLRKLEASRQQITAADATGEQRDAAISRLSEVEAREKRIRDAELTLQGRVLDGFDKGMDGDEQTQTRTRRDIRSQVRETLLKDNLTEINLGGGRYLTNRGIEQVAPDGTRTVTGTFNDSDTANEALAYLHRRHQQQTTAATAQDAADGNRNRAALLDEAERRKLILGDLGYGNEELVDQLQLAADGQSGFETLNELGYMMGAKVSDAQIAATVDIGKKAQELLGGKITDESKETIDTFVRSSRERGRQMLDDERTMEQLGQGGLQLVQDIRESSAVLQSMADEKGVSVQELLAGKGVDRKSQQEAMAHFQKMQENWAEIQDRRDYKMLPGKGRDAENLKRQAMTDQEKEDLQAAQSFAQEYTTAEERANAVVDRMIERATPEQAERLSVDINREKLVKEIAQGDRGAAIDTALRSQDELLEMGIRKGVFGDKTKIGDLTEEERRTASKRLRKLSLTDAEKADLDRLEETAEPFSDFGTEDTQASDVTDDALKRIRQFSNVQVDQIPNQQEGERKVTLEGGNITINDDNTVNMTLKGIELLNPLSSMWS